jgi:hypothetical protein
MFFVDLPLLNLRDELTFVSFIDLKSCEDAAVEFDLNYGSTELVSE